MSLASPEKVSLAQQVLAADPHDEIDYSVYEVANGIRWSFNPSVVEQATSARNFTRFCLRIEALGGVREFLHATTEQLAGGRDGRYTSYSMHKNFTVGAPVDEIIPSYTQRSFHAARYRKYFLGPALLATLAAHMGESDIAAWPLAQIAAGHSYEDVSTALQMKQSTLIEVLLTVVDMSRLKAAWEERTINLMDKTDKLIGEALDADFDDAAEAAKAEMKANVVAKLSGHQKFTSTALVAAYKPAQGNIAVTPGNISISFAMPTD
jgi:hypothetical protein